MKNVIIFLNAALLLVILYFGLIEGFPSIADEPESFFIYVMMVTLALNLFYFLKSSQGRKESLFGVFMQRKILEEKSKIKKLSEDI